MLLLESHFNSTNLIHIIAPFIFGDEGDWHAIDLYLQYSKTHQVMLWSHQPPLESLKVSYAIQQIKPYSGQAPNQGILIICGARTEIGSWYESARFDHIIMLHNLMSPSALYRILNRLIKNGGLNLDIVYVSELVRRFAGLPGRVVYHIPAKERFQSKAKNSLVSHNFTIGRISADILAKHHYSDIDVYRALVGEDMHIRIIGGTCLKPWLENEPAISLLPAVRQTELAEIYDAIDCFYYRVPSTIKDPFPIVVIKAMLAGLPVVCHRDVGAVEIIKHGVNGFIFDTVAQAIEIIKTLKNNANLRLDIGINAKLLNNIMAQ